MLNKWEISKPEFQFGVNGISNFKLFRSRILLIISIGKLPNFLLIKYVSHFGSWWSQRGSQIRPNNGNESIAGFMETSETFPVTKFVRIGNFNRIFLILSCNFAGREKLATNSPTNRAKVTLRIKRGLLWIHVKTIIHFKTSAGFFLDVFHSMERRHRTHWPGRSIFLLIAALWK